MLKRSLCMGEPVVVLFVLGAAVLYNSAGWGSTYGPCFWHDVTEPSQCLTVGCSLASCHSTCQEPCSPKATVPANRRQKPDLFVCVWGRGGTIKKHRALSSSAFRVSVICTKVSLQKTDHHSIIFHVVKYMYFPCAPKYHQLFMYLPWSQNLKTHSSGMHESYSGIVS